MKGTITIKAFEVNENETQLGVYANIHCGGLEDKIRIVHGVMDETNNGKSKIYERIALSMAKEVAIVVGQLLSSEEMDMLVNELFRTTSPSIAPDGSVIVYIMPDKEIERNFSR